MFTDRAGTTPVTTPGQTVGLRLDKSKGLTLGSELVSNGDFSSGTGWTLGTGASIAGGVLAYAGGTSGTTSQPTVNQSGKTYVVTFTIISRSAGAVRVRFAANAEGSLQTAPGTFTLYTKSLSNNSDILVETNGAFVGTIDNISVKELPGNHAVAPTDAARPTYGIEPKTGRRNLLTYTEQFDNAVWAKTAASIPSTNGTAPDGTATADTLREDSTNNTHNLLQSPSASASTAYTASVYFKREAGTRNAYIQVNNNGTGVGGACFAWFDLTGLGAASAVTDLVPGFTSTSAAISSVGSGWYRCSLRLTTVAVTTSLAITPAVYNAGRSYLGDGTSGIYVWGAQLELGSTATAYQRVGTSFDVTEAGVPTVHYVQYDGTDDSFSTSSIDFTATDKMSVFAGVRKLSDATRGIVAELSAAATSGAWNLNAPNATTTANYAFRNVGSLSGGDAVTSSTFAAPTSNVLTALGDIAADVSQLRVNGSVAATSAVDLGTGNYGNYPLFIGRRNNTSLPFNGRDYGILVVGKAASATEITNTESYLAANTSGVTL